MKIDEEIEKNSEIIHSFINTILEIHESIMGNKECSSTYKQLIMPGAKHLWY